MDNQQRGTCIKGLFSPALEQKKKELLFTNFSWLAYTCKKNTSSVKFRHFLNVTVAMVTKWPSK